MPCTYSQIYIQVVFAVKGRESLIHQSWEEQLYKYITGIVQNKEQKMLAINGMPDHIHFLIGMKPSCCLSVLLREVQKSDNEFNRAKKLMRSHFQWREGWREILCCRFMFHNVLSAFCNDHDAYQELECEWG